MKSISHSFWIIDIFISLLSVVLFLRFATNRHRSTICAMRLCMSNLRRQHEHDPPAKIAAWGNQTNNLSAVFLKNWPHYSSSAFCYRFTLILCLSLFRIYNGFVCREYLSTITIMHGLQPFFRQILFGTIFIRVKFLLVDD